MMLDVRIFRKARNRVVGGDCRWRGRDQRWRRPFFRQRMEPAPKKKKQKPKRHIPFQFPFKRFNCVWKRIDPPLSAAINEVNRRLIELTIHFKWRHCQHYQVHSECGNHQLIKLTRSLEVWNGLTTVTVQLNQKWK